MQIVIFIKIFRINILIYKLNYYIKKEKKMYKKFENDTNLKEQIILIQEECYKIITICEGFLEQYSKTMENKSQRQYTVRFPICQPTKVVINGMLRDKTSLSPEERRAVKDQKEINKARAILRLQNITKQKNFGAQIT